jgi:hypothetical protein
LTGEKHFTFGNLGDPMSHNTALSSSPEILLMTTATMNAFQSFLFNYMTKSPGHRLGGLGPNERVDYPDMASHETILVSRDS